MTDLGRSKLDLLGDEAAPVAMALFEQGMAAGELTARTSMFELLTNANSIAYEPVRAAAMIRDASAQDDLTVLTRLLGRYRTADVDVQTALEAELDLPAIYLKAAQAGDIFSMRAYAAYRRDNATDPSDLMASTLWFERAAQGGDVTAMTEYGYALAFGLGTDANLETALVWLERAADAGSLKAANITSLLNLSEDT